MFINYFRHLNLSIISFLRKAATPAKAGAGTYVHTKIINIGAKHKSALRQAESFINIEYPALTQSILWGILSLSYFLV